MPNIHKQISSVLAVAIVGVLSTALMVAANEPTSTPGTVLAPPINALAVDQVKSGGLQLFSLVVSGGAYFDEPIAIGSDDATDGLQATISGSVGAELYCDADGEECATIEQLRPVTCLGGSKFLQWDGSAWICNDPAS